MKVLANIDARVIQVALESANPLTMAGRHAVANYKNFLVSHALTASGLEMSIGTMARFNDAGLENLIAVLKGLMPTSKRKVAIAYEQIQMEAKSPFSAGVEAENALAELYKHNAAAIIEEIRGGALDQYKTNPVIASLIAYANAADRDATMSGTNVTRNVKAASSNAKLAMVPIVNIASLGDSGMMVSIDGGLFILGPNGGLSQVTNLSDFENIPDDIQSVLTVLGNMQLDDKHANIMTISNAYAESLEKYLGIKSLEIDLLGEYDDFVHLNNVKMSVEKAQAILNANKDSIVANIVTSEEAKKMLELVNTILEVFDKYRGSLLSGQYARKFILNTEDAKTAIYVIKGTSAYSVFTTINGSVTSMKKYNTVYELLADETLIATAELSDMVAGSFQSELKAERNTATVRQNILQKLITEREEYENLLSRINSNLKELDEVEDENPDKRKELNQLKAKIDENIKQVDAEIEKLQA